MTKATLLEDFLLNETEARTLCFITENGYIISTAFIDYEDLFIHHVDPKLLKKEVKESKWEALPIVNSDGNSVLIPCLSIEIGGSKDD